MTAATTYKVLWPPTAQVGGAASVRPTSGSNSAPIPMIMYGNGTPAGTLAPWTTAPNGSIWIGIDQTGGDNLWVKMYANGAAADWVALSHADTGYRVVNTAIFDMDAGGNEYDLFYVQRDTKIAAAFLVYTEATDSSGAADGNISAGTAVDGTNVIAATAYAPSTAVGTAVELVLAKTSFSVGDIIYTKNTKVGATEAGKMKVQFLCTYE